MKKQKVYLFYLLFPADDLRVYYNDSGVSKVEYDGTNKFLEDQDLVKFCFNEGFISRKDHIGSILYAYTTDASLADKFELSRNMHKFLRKTKKFTEEEIYALNRYRDGLLRTEEISTGKDSYISIVATDFEMREVSCVDPDSIILKFVSDENVSDFIFTPNAIFTTQDDFLSDEVSDALHKLQFKELLVLDERAIYNRELRLDMNEWNVFYGLFSEILRKGR